MPTRTSAPRRFLVVLLATLISVIARAQDASTPKRMEVPEDFSHFGVPGHEPEMQALRELYWLHYQPAGPLIPLWDAWMPMSTLWPARGSGAEMEAMRARWAAALVFLAGVAVCVALQGAWNQARFGDWLLTGNAQQSWRFFRLPSLERLATLLVSPRRGLFVYSPVLVLGAWGLFAGPRRQAFAAAFAAGAFAFTAGAFGVAAGFASAAFAAAGFAA